MAIFNLTPKQVELLHGALVVGIEGGQEGTDCSPEDVDAIFDVIAELDAFCNKGLAAEITIVRDAPTRLLAVVDLLNDQLAP